MAERNEIQLGIILVDLNVGKDLDVEDEKLIAEETKKYLQDTSRSRGGKLAAGGFQKNPHSEKLQYVVHYANQKSAERVLKHRHHTLQQDEKQFILTVQLCPSDLLNIVKENKLSDAEAVDSGSNDSSNEQAKQFDETFESAGQSSCGSSDIEVITHDETNGFTFVDITEGSKNDSEMLSYGSSNIFPIYSFECVNQFARSIVVKDVPNDLYHPLLLLLENKQRGGGELVFCVRNSVTSQVLVTFKDIGVAESFLKMKLLKILDHFVTVCEPLVFEEQSWKTNVKALFDGDNEPPDVFLKESDMLSFNQQNRGEEVIAFKELVKDDEPVMNDVQANTKSRDKERGKDQEENLRIKEIIAGEKVKGKDFHFVSSQDEVKELQDDLMTTDRQGCTLAAGDENDTSNPVAGDLEISHSFIVSGVTAGDADAVELYLESPKNSGGHIERRIFKESKEELGVTFDKKEVAGNVISPGFLNHLGKSVCPHTQENTDLQKKRESSEELSLEPEYNEELSKVIEIRDVMSQEIAELIVGLLENPRKGGGPIEQESFCEDNKILFLKFKAKAIADYFLRKKIIRILDKCYHISPCVSSVVNICHNMADVKADIHSKDLRKQEEIESVEDHRVTACGPHYAVSENGEEKLSEFDPVKVEYAQKLSSEQSDLYKKELQEMIPEAISSKFIRNKVSEEDPESEEAAIDISHIPSDMTENTLYMIFESKRYGGGEIKCLKFEQLQQKATVIFKDPTVAKSLIGKEFLTFKDAKMLITRPTPAVCKSCDTQQLSSIGINRKNDDCSIEVSSIPSDMNEETLQMIFESKRFGGDDLENLTFNKENRTAIVKFRNPAVALNLLSKSYLSFNGNELKIARPLYGKNVELNSQGSKNNCIRYEDEVSGRKSVFCKQIQRVMVSNIDSSVTEDTLYMIFESKRYGGGKIDGLEYNMKNGTAVITFEDPSVAASLLNKGTVKFKSMQLLLSKCEENDSCHGITSQLKRPESFASGDFNTLKISGIPPSVSECMISMYFENKNRSGGGNLSVLSYQKRKGKAVIKFDRASDAQNVCKKKHCIHGANLEISALELPLNVKSYAIEVKGYNKNVTKDLLELYFENRHRSGGGQVDEMFLDTQQNSAVIVFQKAEDVLEVMQRQPHMLDGVSLDVRVLEPAPPPPFLMEEADKLRLLAKHLPPWTTIDSLKSYLKRATVAEMVGWMKGDKHSLAILDFSSEPDYLALRHLVSSRPFQGKMISIRRVPFTSSILVTDLPAAAQEVLIAMYFENEIAQWTSDAENECIVEMIPDKGCAIVRFKTHKVIPSIISQPHYIEKKLVKLQPYYPWLGLNSRSSELDLCEARNTSSSNLQSIILACDVKALQYISKHPQLQKEIEDSLKNNNCTVQWPTAGTKQVKLYSMEKEDLSSKWKAENKQILMSFVDQLTWKKQNVLPKIWADLYKKVSANVQTIPIEIVFNSDACEIQYFGLDRYTAEFEKLLSEVQFSLENDSNRERKKVSETVTSFKKFQIDLLESSVVQDHLKKNFSDLQCLFRETEIHLCGISDDVKKAKLYLFEMISSVVESSFKVSLPKAKVLVKDTVNLYLKEQLLKCGICAAWFCVDDIVKVYAFDQSSLLSATELFHNEIAESHVELKNENMSLTDSLSWKEFTAGLRNDHISLEIDVLNSAVVVVCTKNSVEEVMKRLNKYVDEHSIMNHFLPMDCGVVDLISRCMSKQFEQIEKNLKEYEGKVNKIFDGNNPGFSVCGKKAGVDKAASDLCKLADDIVFYDHIIDRPGIPAYFYSKQGKEVLNGIQLNHNVSIQLDDLTNQPQVLPTSNRYHIEVKPGKCISLQSGDITRCNTDAIVNAANEELRHIGGVAAAIAEAAGPDLEEDSRAYVKLQGKLLPGQACITRAGKLSCKQVIHAVGPRWKGGNAGEDEILFAAVLSSLQIGEKEGLQSIAMPLISTGIFGYPLDKAADIIVECVRQYFWENQSTTVREVLIIDNDRLAVDFIEKKLRSIADQHPPEHSSSSQRIRNCKDPEKLPKLFQASSIQCVGSVNMGLQEPFSSDKDIIYTTEGMKITLVKGSISNLKADILVNTTGKDLNLSHGNVSKSLLAVAGSALQSECDKKKPRNFNYGDIVVTSGHGLQCHYVFHGSCRGWDNGDGNCEKTVQAFMKNLLDKGEFLEQKSVAIPAIGTGNLRIPHEIVANIMYDEVLMFSNHRKPKFLLDIQFVVYDKDVDSIKAFEKKIHSLKQAKISNISENSIHSQSLSLSPFLHSSAKDLLKNEDRLSFENETGGMMEHRHTKDHKVERLPINLSRVILSIYALNQKTVENVLKDIENIIEEYIIDKVLESPHDQENISKLSQVQIQRIKSMASRFSVQIEIEHHNLKRIRIRGAPMDVSSVVDQIHLIFQEVCKTEIKKKEEEWIATVAQWEYKDGNDFEKYPDDINAIIEKAFREGRVCAEWEEENAKYRLNFEKMVEEFMTKPGTSPVKVRRVPKEIDVPTHWETMKDDEIYKSVLLNSNDDEYKDVAKAVLATSQNCFNTIVKIERIQNKMLYKQYLARKMAMNSANTISQNEKTLWHGTSADTLGSINQMGFNRSYCGKNAVVYGRGVYFAKHFSYSAQNQYSPPDRNGIKHIYQGKVLTGDYTVGKQNLIVPPLKPGSTTLRYDSTVDNDTNPTIFVIFYDTQAYPEYLVYFK